MSEATALCIAGSGTPRATSRRDVMSASAAFPEADIREEVERVLRSVAFARSPRITRFLAFTVDQALSGMENRLKEYLLGVEVFGRPDSFDPRIDSIVRVEARRLRFKLERYYETEGRNDLIQIQFRKGCYTPFFQARPVDGPGGAVPGVPNVIPVDDAQTFVANARGRACLRQGAPAGVRGAVAWFKQAIERDPRCAPAHAGLATAWILSSLIGLTPPLELIPKAKAAASRAISLNPACVEAQAALGAALSLYDLDRAEGERLLRKAVQTNPSGVNERLWRAFALTLAGRFDDAAQEAREAQQAAPERPAAHLASGFALHLAGAPAEALRHYRLARDLEPEWPAPRMALGLAMAESGMTAQAVEQADYALRQAPDFPLALAVSAYCHHAAGDATGAADAAAELDRAAAAGYVCPFAHALARSAAGNLDGAFEKLEEATRQRSPWLAAIRFTRLFEPLRADSRYEALAQGA